MSEISELLERFRRGPELIAAVTTGAAGSELDFVPGPGKWSVRQIAAHLADSEIVAADRFRRVLAEDNPTLMAYDQDAWARNLNYSRRKISDSLDIFRRIRADNYELLKDLPEPAFERKGNHTEHGSVLLRQLVETYAAHPEGHARQVKAVREQYKQHRAQAGGGTR